MTEGRTKVLFLITKGNLGGAQKYVFDLATKLPLDIYNPVVAFGEAGVLEEMLEKEGIRTIALEHLQRDVSIFKEFHALGELVRILQEEKPDILHINSSKAGFIGGLAGRLARVPYIVFTAHGWASNEDRGQISKIIFKIFHWLTIVLAHQTIAVSKKTADDMRSLPFVRKKISVVYNGIEPRNFEQKQSIRTIIAPHVHEGVWIGTVSELHRNKGIDFAIRAFASLTETYQHIAFVVIGEGEERGNLEKLRDELGLVEKVHFLGKIPDAGTLIPAFDIFTLTSRTEAFPYTILEAGLAEVAVVASRVGGIPEVVTDKKSGYLVETGNIKALTESIADLIEHPDKRERFARELHRVVGKNFLVERMVKETEKIYR